MDRLRYLAFVSVGRGSGFAGLAIFTVMVALSFDPLLAAKSGAILLTLATVILRYFAMRAPERDHRRTELWVMLEPEAAPPPALAQRLVGKVLAETYSRFSDWALYGAAALWAVSAVLWLVR
jgi:hypothetical protein